MLRICSIARARVLVLLFCSPFLFNQAPAFAQGTTVSVSGTVRDASGGVLPQTTVETVVAGRAVATTLSDENGQYRITVASGVPFALRARLDGFADFTADLLGTSADVVRHITLQVGTASDTVVVTASRGADSRAAVTSSVTVVSDADIQALGAAQLTDVMRFVPGVAIEGNGREGALTSMFSRGGESDYNLVLIDGVRVNLQGGAFDFSRIGAREIERVEVVRGAQSSLWGSDAMGSVVQVFTRRAGAYDRPRVSGSVEFGSFSTRRGDLGVSGGAAGIVDYRAGVTFRATDGAFGDILTEKDWYEQTALDGSLGVRLGSRANVRTGVRHSLAQGRNVGPITYGARDTGGTYTTKNLSWHTDVAHTGGSRYTGYGTVNYFRYQQLSADTIADPSYTVRAILTGTPNAPYPNGVRLVRLIDEPEWDSLVAAGALPAPGQFLASATSFDFVSATLPDPTVFVRPSVRYQGDYAWATGQRLSVGYEWEREQFTDDPSNDVTSGLSVDNNAVFVQQQSTFADRWFVTVGVRLDDKQQYDRFISPKLSAGGYIVPLQAGGLSSLKVFGNIGKGIKSPSVAERFGASYADPNPDLRVERARTSDLGVEATFASQHLRTLVTWFYNDYEDQIAFRFGTVGDGIPEFINIDGSRAQGWELELALQRPVGGFTAGATYALVDTEVVTNLSTSQQFQPGQPLIRRPKHTGTVRAAQTVGIVTVNFDLRIVGDRHDNSFLFMSPVSNAERTFPQFASTDITVNPGYTVAGLGVDVRLDRMVTVFVRGNNITDTVYDSALGYPGMPRTVMAGATFDLGRR